MLEIVRTFLRDDAGATAIEYGLIAALVSVAAVLALQGLGSSLARLFEFVEIKLISAVTTP